MTRPWPVSRVPLRRLGRALGVGVAAGLAWAAAGASGPAGAQGLLGPGDGTGDGAPIEVEADGSLEWHEELRLYVARGNAVLRQGSGELRAQTITAHYREAADGGNQIFRLIAEGGVVVSDETQSVEGDRLEYDLDSDTVIVTGDGLKLETATEVVTADDSLEYYQAEQVAVARGNARAVRGTDTVDADVLVAEFAEGAEGNQTLTVLNALGSVLIITDRDIARGDEAVYNVAEQRATLSGAVRLTSGDSQLNGDYAEIDLESGISRLLALPEAEGRVRALLVPAEAE